MNQKVFITGSGSFLPGSPVDNNQMKELIPDLPVEVLSSYFGIEQRFMVVDPVSCERKEQMGSLQMSVQAARRAAEAAGIDLKDVDLVITNTTTPESPLPPISFLLQKELGIPKAQIFDLRGGCAASVQALHLAKTMIATGQATTALLCGVECTSPVYYKYLKNTPDPDMDVVLNGFIFGDGAGALILQNEKAPATGRQKRRQVRFCGSQSHFAKSPVGFQILNEVDPVNPMVVTTSTKHSNRAISKTLPSVMKAAFGHLTGSTGLKFEDFDRIIVPQVNESLLKTAYPEAVDSFVHNFSRMGNIPGAAIFIAYDQAVNSGRDDVDKFGIVAIETVSWMYAVAELTSD